MPLIEHWAGIDHLAAVYSRASNHTHRDTDTRTWYVAPAVKPVERDDSCRTVIEGQIMTDMAACGLVYDKGTGTSRIRRHSSVG